MTTKPQMNRRPKSMSLHFRVATLSFVALMLFMPITVAQTRAPLTTPSKRNNAGDDDPSYLLTMTRSSTSYKNVLTLITIPASGHVTQAPGTKIIDTSPVLHSDFRLIGVHGGHVIGLTGFKLVAISLNDGIQRSVVSGWVVNAVLRNERIFYVARAKAGNEGDPLWALSELELETGDRRELCRIHGVQSPMQGMSFDFSIAVNRDGSKVAVTEIVGEPRSYADSCHVLVVDRNEGKVVGSDAVFVPRLMMTGGGDHLLAPKIAWVDGGVLVAAQRKKAAPADGLQIIGNGIGIIESSGELELSLFNPATRKVETVCEIPRFSMQMHEPFFTSDHQRRPVLHLGALGAYRVDLDDKKLIEQSHVGNGYQVRGARKEASLWFHGERLSNSTSPDRIFVSDDGNRVAWLPVGVRNGIVLNDEAELRIHGRTQGTRSVLKGRFSRPMLTAQGSATAICHWITEGQMSPSSYVEKLPKILAPATSQRPHVDSRPKATESASVTMATDKQRYKLHERVKLSVTVRNLTKEAFRFPSNRVKHGGQPFDVNLHYDRGRSWVYLFEDNVNEPKGPFVEIPAGASRTFSRWVEVENPGKQEFRIRFEDYSLWSGYVKASVPFTVEKTTDNSLLQAKFDRLIEQCLQEYRRSPNSVRSSRFWQLGEPGVPLLIGYLKSCEDGRLRDRLGRGLEAHVTETALPYLEDLLESDLEHDGSTLIKSLWHVAWREKEPKKAISLLVKAGKHSNPSVRLQAVEQLYFATMPEVDRFMQIASEDADIAVATAAAKYVVARQGLPLDEWLEYASSNVTPGGVVAAQSVISRLERDWKMNFGSLPQQRFGEIISRRERLEQYTATLQKWAQWARENQRTSASFLSDEIREHTRHGIKLSSPGSDSFRYAPSIVCSMDDGTKVQIRGEHLDGRALEYLQGMDLEYLQITDSKIKDEDLLKLTKTKRIGRLAISQLRISGPGLAHLQNVNGLEELEVPIAASDESMTHLKNLESLKRLAITKRPLSADALKAIASLSKLEELYFFAVPMTDDGFKLLRPLDQLQKLDLGYTLLTDAGMGVLRNFPRLHSLHLNGSSVSDEGAKTLAELDELRSLRISGPVDIKVNLLHTELQRKKLQLQAEIAQLPDDAEAGRRIYELRLKFAATEKRLQREISAAGSSSPATGGRLTNAGLLQIGKLTELEELAVDGMMTSEGLAAITDMNELKFLSVPFSVAYAGGKHLKQLRSLQLLTCRAGDNIPQEQRNELQASLPGVGILFVDP